MILSRITEYLNQHRRASVVDMSYGLNASPDALRAMLSRLESKGRVRRLPDSTPCSSSGCSKCAPGSVELYEWVDEK